MDKKNLRNKKTFWNKITLCGKNRAFAVTSLLIAGALVLNTFAAPYDIFGAAEKNEIDKAVEKITDAVSKENTAIDLTKKDIMYVITDANGAPTKAILSDANGLTNQDLAGYTQPVDVKISYTLDGADISANEIAGKSGHVTIRFDYTNNDKQPAEIDGTTELLNVPYLAVSGAILDGEFFSNVVITHGKCISEGKRIIAGGIALPGMKEDIDPEGKIEDVQKIPEYIEIAADTTCFKLSTTLTAVLPFNLEEIDITSFHGLENLESDIDKLTDAMSKLLDGSSKLATGSKDLAAGASKLRGGIKELRAGLDKLSGNSKALTDGAATIFKTILDTVTGELNAAGLTVPSLTISNYKKTLDGIISQLDETNVYNQALQMVTAQVEANRPAIETGVKQAVSAQISAAVRPLVIAAYEQATSSVYDETTASEEVKLYIASQIEDAVADKMQTDDVKAQIKSNTDAQIQILIDQNMNSDEVKAKLAAASEGAKKVIEAKGQLDSIEVFYLGVKTYTSGVDSASAGIGQIYDGAKDLSNGANDVSDGMKSLDSGLGQLNDEGIKKLTDLFGGDMATAIKRISKVLELGEKAKDMTYIIRSASIDD